ncbi:hypothetical protein D7V31_06990 [Acinetobacter sp. WCHAc060007]|nr:hypothetical protein D7V31_06990 [Acinetobacter sp. WCHAc060007]
MLLSHIKTHIKFWIGIYRNRLYWIKIVGESNEFLIRRAENKLTDTIKNSLILWILLIQTSGKLKLN